MKMKIRRSDKRHWRIKVVAVFKPRFISVHDQRILVRDIQDFCYRNYPPGFWRWGHIRCFLCSGSVVIKMYSWNHFAHPAVYAQRMQIADAVIERVALVLQMFDGICALESNSGMIQRQNVSLRTPDPVNP